ncbi:MAG: ABC transporter ATP-binding protein [Opitutaceae bacterium]|nr:ABC transporter ATP-binding protein [Opitutaceae bacterium]
MTEADATIEVEHLVKHFGRTVAVNDISFTVRRGEIIGFLGPNGAGKSTTMRILTGYLPANAGVVKICGKSVASSPLLTKRHIGYMPENNPLPEDLRVREYLTWRGHLKGLRGRRLRERLEAVLEQCDLQRAHRRIIGTLSKGFRQRVGVADAILAEPEVIIMDEPTIGLDPHQIIMIRDLISRLRGRMSVILSSHILPEIEATCDRVLIINHGRIVAAGTPDQLRSEFINRTGYEIEVHGELAAVRRALEPLGESSTVEAAEGTPDGDGFQVVTVQTGAARDHGEQILRLLGAAEGVRVRALTRHQATLEEVFLAATRRSWETTIPLKGDAARAAIAATDTGHASHPGS